MPDLIQLINDNWLILAEMMAKREAIPGKNFSESEGEGGGDEADTD